MAAAATNSKRLPKELQEYKKSLKELSFQEKVKAYFDCSPYLRDLDAQKEEIILKSFTKDEREEYYRVYQPIHSAIDRYGDRIRAINGNVSIYSFYINNELRQRDVINYTADFLNRVLPKVKEALEGTKEENTRETLTEAYDKLKGYRVVNLTMPNSYLSMNRTKTEYKIDTTITDKSLREVIQTLKGLLSLLKCYLEALKEFLAWLGKSELYPKEFSDMENLLKLRYKPIQKESTENPNAKEFPLWSFNYEIVEEFISIDYDALPRTIDIFGERNLFANTYRNFFKY